MKNQRAAKLYKQGLTQEDIERQKLKEYDSVLNNQKISEQERMERVKQRARELEVQALKDEQLMKVAGEVDDVSKSIAVNDKYIESINAKLKLLD